jgi:apolipoprotein N-acyltransferase
MQLADDRGAWRLPALSGVLYGTSFLSGPFLALSFTAFLPLLAWLHGRPRASGHARLAAGFAFGLVAYLIGLHFMYAMLSFSWLAALLYVAMSAAEALRFAVTVVLLGWLRQRTGLSWALLLPLCWLPCEWLETWGDLRMTADHLAYSVARYPFLVQFADVVGPYGVGGVLLVANGLLFETVASWRRPAGRRALAGLIALAVVVLAYDAWAWTRPLDSHGRLRVGLVQPNVPIAVKHDDRTLDEQWTTLAELSRQAAREGARLILWPESARPFPVLHRLDRPETFAMPEVQALARSLDAAFVVGVEYARMRGTDDYELFNAALAVDSGGRLLEQWGAKVYLVPFTEGVPFEGLLGPLVKGRGGEWHWLSGGFTPGPQLPLLDIAGTRVGLLVCYEQLFPELARRLRNSGAELQAVITNDAWWGRSYFQSFQANALRLRAIENRTAFVRVANTGISGFVDSRGRYHQRTKLFEQAVEVRDVELSSRRTIYDRTGDLVAWLAVAGLAATAVAARGAQPSVTR